MADGKEQRAKSKEQRAKSKEQRADDLRLLLSFADRLVIDHIDLHGLIRRDKFTFILVTAVVRGLELVPEKVSVLVHASFVYRSRDNFAHNHESMQPLLRPLYLALEVTPA